ncbi:MULTISPECIES: MFS transporter [unclassified Streptomyces]|uniref:MFS transporter n=2 Tax=Streptomyces TaxID=1883 RepID=UPI0001C1934B|nr:MULTISPECIES: MFS transporter [unclassified Streptomyces]AEN09859.1 major facilitator superfamily MFS_1 [Streptomyces sp. SirexAA-E]MYR64819.1 MFS transporter [Streptomyces sp. SID4939]MYT64283.1 MFS transporter [Streptomyces sp. SID8357]MYT87096.1 MFS transporter [Streptomyces sp. SID8360]MYU34543.1 MFS transporter [Streptomyces sp. SID8358]
MAIENLTTPPARPVGPAAPARLSGRARLVLFVLCAAQFMVALDFSVLNVALPVLGRDLGLGRSGLQWAVTAFALPSGGFLLLFGRIADLYGRRRLFLAGLAVFGASSVLATLAWDPASFLAGRALQGLGAAVIVPTGMSLLTTTFPEGPLRDRALGISGTLLSLGFTVGMVAGGVLTDTLGWRSTMGLLAAASALVLALAPRALGESRTPDRPRLDVPGALTVTGGLLALIYSLSTAAERGFGGADVLATLVAGLVLLTAFVVVETRSAAPLVSLPMLRRRTVAFGNLGGLATVSMMTTTVFVLTLYLQEVLGLSPLGTGLVFGAQGVVSAAAGVYVSRVIGRIGARRTLGLSLLGQGVFTAALLTLGEESGVWPATVAVSLASVFHLGAIVSYGLTVTSGVPDEEQGLATGLVTTTQQVGMTVGIPLLGVLATTQGSLYGGVRLVTGAAALVLVAAGVAVAAGLRRPAA